MFKVTQQSKDLRAAAARYETFAADSKRCSFYTAALFCRWPKRDAARPELRVPSSTAPAVELFSSAGP